MKILIDEMPYFSEECPFYEAYEEICKCDGNRCEHYASTKRRKTSTD